MATLTLHLVYNLSNIHLTHSFQYAQGSFRLSGKKQEEEDKIFTEQVLACPRFQLASYSVSTSLCVVLQGSAYITSVVYFSPPTLLKNFYYTRLEPVFSSVLILCLLGLCDLRCFPLFFLG
ncbi:hypothetical protein PtA15_3A884 [Puccinia triticina]|uniref:Uncharacterized protein n=1 Tax=Puccinia triticina TaxID=208348 RepID=A0ABY7CE76_9BASI|nr:uncharacterized protein PtA15_3A884 [Puccinia triticina]WAQ83513.1 hypothetical protein PtA15_3A884 [Puccinia triticina]